MTEADWLTCGDPPKMLEFLRGKVSDRKLRLYACACVRRLWEISPEDIRPDELQTTEMTERFVESTVTEAETKLFQQNTYDPGTVNAYIAIDRRPMYTAYTWGTTMASRAGGIVSDGVSEENVASVRFDCGFRAALTAHCDLLREIVGNPFRRMMIDPAWLIWNNGTIVQLARTVYEDCRFELMPILADALEEIGCGEPVLLEHCREPGPHMRGCWVVDLLLNKE